MPQFVVIVERDPQDDMIPFLTMYHVRQFTHILDELEISYHVFKLLEV